MFDGSESPGQAWLSAGLSWLQSTLLIKFILRPSTLALFSSAEVISLVNFSNFEGRIRAFN